MHSLGISYLTILSVKPCNLNINHLLLWKICFHSNRYWHPWLSNCTSLQGISVSYKIPLLPIDYVMILSLNIRNLNINQPLLCKICFPGNRYQHLWIPNCTSLQYLSISHKLHLRRTGIVMIVHVKPWNLSKNRWLLCKSCFHSNGWWNFLAPLLKLIVGV